jgi:ABC-type uncharacterized transport system permease subunit
MLTADLLLAAPFWVAVLRIATPLILGTLGVLLCERAGVLNLGIEGIMVAGAFAGWLAVYQGCRCGAAWRWRRSPARFGLLHGVLTVTLALSQHVAGLGITLLATSLASYAYRVSFPKVDSRRPSRPSRRWPGCRSRCWRADAAHAAGAAAGAAGGLGAVPHAAGAGAAHGGREPGRRRRARA